MSVPEAFRFNEKYDEHPVLAYVDSRQIERVISSCGFHYHNKAFEIHYYLEGSCRIHTGGKIYTAGPGDLVIFHPGVAHEEFFQTGILKLLCMRCREDLIVSSIPGKQEIGPVIHLPWKERFRSLFENIIIESQHSDEWSKTIIGTYLVQFSILLRRALIAKKQERRQSDGTTMRFSNIINILVNRMNTNIPLRDLAAESFMSMSNFSHAFKKIIGVSPRHYQIQTRMEKAKELLAASTRPVTEIADLIGYQNHTYFCRLFKKSIGCTPGQYRQKSKKVS